MTVAIVIIVLLAGNAFFVAAEFALISSRRTVVEPMAETSRRARLALKAMSEIPLAIAGTQLGVTVCSLGLGALAEPAIARLLDGPFGEIDLPEAVTHTVAFVIGLLLVMYVHTAFGEMVPKNLTLAGPENAVLWLGPPMYAFCAVTKPLLVATKWVSRQVLRIWNIEGTDEVKTVFTTDELVGLVAQSRVEGLIDPAEYTRISGALALHDRMVADATLPWADVTTVPDNVSAAALEVLASRTRRSRFPVVDQATRRVIGFVHVKDVIGMVGSERRAPIPPSTIREMAAIRGDRSLADALLLMRRDRRHMMLVSDGRTVDGVITLDDVLRAVVGNRIRPKSVEIAE